VESLVVGVAGIVAGSLVAGFGTRVFYLLLPLFAAVVGFLVGAELAAVILGEGFLATAVTWIAGIGLGIVFAVIAGAFWYLSVLILAGGVGYAAGSGLLAALGVEPGVLTAAAGGAGAAGLVILAVAVDVPTLLVAFLTAMGGSALGVAGAWLLLGRITLADVGDLGPLGALRGQPLAMGAWLVLGLLAFAHQVVEWRTRDIDRAVPAGA
jgi:hypothetical protein